MLLISGPNWAGNFVDAPIIVSNDGKEFFKQPMYYVMAHFSKFIPPGSVKIQMDPLPKLDSVAFKTPSNQIVVVVHNRGSKSVDYSIRYMDKSISGQADGDSLQTIVFQL